jgi:hypothetical protein
MRKKEELERAIRLLEEYQRLASTWDPNAPRPAEPDSPRADTSKRTPPVISGKWKI